MDRPNEQRKRKPWIPLTATLLVVAIAAGFFMRPFSFYYAYSDLRLWLGGAHSGAVVVHGIRVHYYVAGTREGPAIVLVHGLGGRSENWLPMLPYLTRAGYRVYMIDLPGFGRSDRPRNFSYSMRAQAFIVAQFMNALNLNEADLAGWSMGGWVAQFVAAEHPEHVRRLILFSSAGVDQIPAWNMQLFTPANADEVRWLVALLMPHPPYVPDFVARDFLRGSSRDAWITHRVVNSMLATTATSDLLLPKLQMPIMIVWGSEDRIFPLSQGEAMHSFAPQARFETVPGCGHLAVLQCAPSIGPEVMQFLKQ